MQVDPDANLKLGSLRPVTARLSGEVTNILIGGDRKEGDGKTIGTNRYYRRILDAGRSCVLAVVVVSGVPFSTTSPIVVPSFSPENS